MKSINIEKHCFGVGPEIVAKVARTAVSYQQQRKVEQRAERLATRENRTQVFSQARAAVSDLVRLVLALSRAAASGARAD